MGKEVLGKGESPRVLDWRGNLRCSLLLCRRVVFLFLSAGRGFLRICEPGKKEMCLIENISPKVGWQYQCYVIIYLGNIHHTHLQKKVRFGNLTHKQKNQTVVRELHNISSVEK